MGRGRRATGPATSMTRRRSTRQVSCPRRPRTSSATASARPWPCGWPSRRRTGVASLTLFEPVLFAAAPDGSEKRANAETLARMEPMIAAGDERDAARLFLSVWGSGEDFDAPAEGRGRAHGGADVDDPGAAHRAARRQGAAFAEVGAGPLPGSADGRRGVAAGDRADPRHARGRAFRRAAREDRGRGAHGTDHPCRRGCRGAR